MMLRRSFEGSVKTFKISSFQSKVVYSPNYCHKPRADREGRMRVWMFVCVCVFVCAAIPAQATGIGRA